MPKRIKLLFLLLISLSSCNQSQKSDAASDSQKPAPERACKWQSLPKTMNYQAEMEKLSEPGRDTLIVLETVSIGTTTYKTTLDIKQNELKAWIDIEGEGQKQIVLHQEDFVESFLTITTTFDAKNCKATRKTETLDPTTGNTGSKTEELNL